MSTEYSQSELNTWPGDVRALHDEAMPKHVVDSEHLVSGRVWDVRRDQVDLGDSQIVTRDVQVHPGAVGVVVLDEANRVLLIRQYRHPVGMYLWEPVAGLLDEPDEAPLAAAQRELVEEAGLHAGRWDVLADYLSSPGGSSECLRIYLARDPAPSPGGRPPGDGEERDLPSAWVPVEDAVNGVLAGRLNAPITVIGLLACARGIADDWSWLRPVESPWPSRDAIVGSGRARSAASDTGKV